MRLILEGTLEKPLKIVGISNDLKLSYGELEGDISRGKPLWPESEEYKSIVSQPVVKLILESWRNKGEKVTLAPGRLDLDPDIERFLTISGSSYPAKLTVSYDKSVIKGLKILAMPLARSEMRAIPAAAMVEGAPALFGHFGNLITEHPFIAAGVDRKSTRLNSSH